MGRACYIADNATLAGDIVMGDDCSVWFSAVLRADVDAIRIGNRVNIQDGACIHESGGAPTILEDDVSVGHLANVHGCVVRRGALVGKPRRTRATTWRPRHGISPTNEPRARPRAPWRAPGDGRQANLSRWGETYNIS